MKGKKKYKYGTNNTVADYMETPAEALAENDIALAQAKYEGASNPWLLGMKAVGNLAMQYGINQGGLNSKNEEDEKLFSGMTDRSGNAMNSLLPLLGNMGFKHGGTAEGNVEAEGGEQVSLPDGDSFELKGANHEQGGVDMNVPPGTEIFSKRISRDGMTMAKREKRRKAKLKRFEKKVADNPTDKVLLDSYERTKQVLTKEKEKDLAIQDTISFIAGSNSEAMFGLSGTPGLPDILDFMMYGGTTGGKKKKAIFGMNGGFAPTGQGDTPAPDEDEVLGLTGGDIIGLFGNVFSGVAPYLNTLKNRAEDTPNINAYRDYGKEGLQKLEQAKDYIAGQQDEELGDVELSRAANIRRGRNTARGVNTSRALDIANSQLAGEQKANINNQYANRTMQLLGMEATAEDKQDQVVMAGEQARDLADRQDKDNFRTQLSANLQDIGTGIQQTGKDLNQAKQQEAIFALLNQLSKYGITFDASSLKLQNPES